MSKREVMSTTKKEDEGVYLKFQYEDNKATGERIFKGLALSDGTIFENVTDEKLKKFQEVVKKATGTGGLEDAIEILFFIALGMSQDSNESRIERVAKMMPLLKPQNETEALILGQFLTIQNSALNCLRRVNHQDGFYHTERYFILASKLFAQANATMQTLLKYRSGGQQTVQVVHVYNEKGQAIVAQNLSHSNRGEGCE